MVKKYPNSQSGVEPKTCKDYEKIAAIFDEKPNMKPVSLAFNRRRNILENDDSVTPAYIKKILLKEIGNKCLKS